MYTHVSKCKNNKIFLTDLSKLNQEDINNLNRCITSSEIEAVINKSSGLNAFTAEIYQTYKEELKPIVPKLLHRKGRNAAKHIVGSQHYLNIKIG
jgi:uracil DNA glycosylase